MSNQNAINLAAEMNVSLADLMALVTATANSIEHDKVAAEQVSQDLVEAYIPVAVKKIETFTAEMMTNEAAHNQFCVDVFNQLKSR
jgi:hypothetical protein